MLRFPSQGPTSQVSLLQRYYQSATTSCLPSRHASFPSLGGTTAVLVDFAPRPTPIVRLLMLFDSGETVCPRPMTLDASNFRATAWLLLRERQRLSQNENLRSSITWLSNSLRAPSEAWSASWCKLPDTTQDSLPAVGQMLPDGLFTRKTPAKGFKAANTSHPPFPSFLAQSHRPTRRKGTSGQVRKRSFGLTVP